MNLKSINPTQLSNSVENLRYPEFWQRAVATVIDTLVFIPLIGYVQMEASIDFHRKSHLAILLVFIICAGWLYYAGLESSPSQATIGKTVMNMKVVDLDGNRIGFKQASIRFFGKILSKLILYIGFIMAAFTPKKQALHDILAKTLVVRK